LIGSEIERIKILGDGDLKKAITVKAHKISESAMKKLTAAGAKIELL
jgi:large subunit ribosomal protein L15